MLDVCIVAPGGFPSITGGLSRWVEVVCRSLSSLELGVWSLGDSTNPSAQFEVPPQVKVLQRGQCLGGVPPEAQTYLVCGPLIVEWAELYHELLPRTVYVEHGDQERELQIGAFKCEAGTTLHRRAVAETLRNRDLAARACRWVVGVHGRTERRLSSASFSRASTIPNAVPPLAPSSNRSELGKHVGFVGRACPVKGVDRLPALQKELPDLRLVAKGPTECADAPLLREIETFFEGREQDVWGVLPGVIVMPSRSEGSPFVALEAEARGVPVVMTPGAEVGDSSLIRQVPWGHTWPSEVREALALPDRRTEGTRLATLRWQKFTAAWNSLLSA